MAVQDTNTIDIVAHDPKADAVMLVMVEVRDWGDRGALLPELQSKLNAYMAYALEGQLAKDYPAFAGKPIRFELRTQHPPTQREQQFLDIVTRKALEPAHITFLWKLLGTGTPQPPPKPKWKFW